MPLHGNNQSVTRTIDQDAQDILAMIEGGLDSNGGTQVGILSMPAYQAIGRGAIVGYSLGTISARYLSHEPDGEPPQRGDHGVGVRGPGVTKSRHRQYRRRLR